MSKKIINIKKRKINNTIKVLIDVSAIEQIGRKDIKILYEQLSDVFNSAYITENIQTKDFHTLNHILIEKEPIISNNNWADIAMTSSLVVVRLKYGIDEYIDKFINCFIDFYLDGNKEMVKIE